MAQPLWCLMHTGCTLSAACTAANTAQVKVVSSTCVLLHTFSHSACEAVACTVLTACAMAAKVCLAAGWGCARGGLGNLEIIMFVFRVVVSPL